MIILIIVFLFLLIFSAFFSSSETAFFSLAPPELHKNDNSPNIHKIKKLLLKADNLLITLLVSNIFINISATTILEHILINYIPQNYIEISTVILMTIIILIFGEVIPKTYALRNAFFLASKYSTILSLIHLIISPLAVLLKKINSILMYLSSFILKSAPKYVTSKELCELLQNEWKLSSKKMNWIKRIIKLKDYNSKDIMTPRNKVLSLDFKDVETNAISLAVKNKFSRIPLWDNDQDNIIGIFNTSSWFKVKNTVLDSKENYILEPQFIPDQKAVIDLLPYFRNNLNSILIVINEHSEFVGIITLDDIMSCIIREMENSGPDGDSFIRKIKKNTFHIDSLMKKEDFETLLNVEFPESNATTVNGILLDVLERIPFTGEFIKYRNISFTVLKANNKMTIKLLVVKSQKD